MDDPCDREAVSRVCCGPFATREGNWCFCNEGRSCHSCPPTPPRETAAFHINVPKVCLPFDEIASAVAAENKAKASGNNNGGSSSSMPKKPADAPSTCHGTRECYGVPDDSFHGPAPPPPKKAPGKIYKHKYGFYLHVFHDPAAVMWQVEQLAKVYPESPVYIMSDGGNDYSDFCNDSGGSGTPRCTFKLCPPANDRWHPWPFLHRLYVLSDFVFLFFFLVCRASIYPRLDKWRTCHLAARIRCRFFFLLLT